MKNVKDYQLKKCIVMKTYEFESLIKKLLGNAVEVEFTLEGIWIGYTNDTSEIPFEDLSAKLAEYFDVKDITSVHLDDCYQIGVWICYKED